MAPQMSKNKLPEASGDPLGTPWAPGGCQDAIKIDPGALLEASGGEKKFTGSGRGASRKVLGPFFSVLRRPQGDFDLHFGSSWELQGGHFGSSLPKTPKPWILNTFHVKTLILKVPGDHFRSFFGPKVLKKQLSARNRPK